MECVASTLHTTSEHGVSSITTADAHTLVASSSTELTPTAVSRERRNLVSARVPSHFNWPVRIRTAIETITADMLKNSLKRTVASTEITQC